MTYHEPQEPEAYDVEVERELMRERPSVNEFERLLMTAQQWLKKEKVQMFPEEGDEFQR